MEGGGRGDFGDGGGRRLQRQRAARGLRPGEAVMVVAPTTGGGVGGRLEGWMVVALTLGADVMKKKRKKKG
ncbi:unnamed protein product [Linum trigynum]|uniref:Uncharacterized protein n=1 Tax=Linum trigynum TaxID=586398 RepID=A0AAV2CYF1_9ROSI